MQIRKRLNLPTATTEFEKDLIRELQTAWDELAEVINGGLKPADNFNSEIVRNNNTGTADTQFVIAHSLKRIPTQFRVVLNDKSGVVYKGSTAWDENFIYLKCSAANADITVEIS